MTLKLYPLHALLPIGPSGEPPRDFTLIRKGILPTVYGDFYWDSQSAELVNKAWAKRARRFMWDYQHLSDKDGRVGADGKPTPMASVHDRRAAGDAATPRADEAGLHLNDQKWTPDADGYIRRREYLYYSPVIAIDESSKPPGRIVDVLKSSLTNDPATLGCAPLMLSGVGGIGVDSAAGVTVVSQIYSLSADETQAASEIEALTVVSDVASASTASTEQTSTQALSVVESVTPQPTTQVELRDKPHPHNSPAKHEVAAVLVHRESDGHTLWGKRNDSGKHTSPGGRVKPSERPIETAQRELKEEAGIEVPHTSLAYLGTVRLATNSGAPIDVHGYRCTIPDHVVPTGERDPDREVSTWDYHPTHPLTTMHAPRNALSILSARHEHLNFSPASVPSTKVSLVEVETVKTPIELTKLADKAKPEQGSHMTKIGSMDMNLNKARSLCLSLIGGLPSLSVGDGVNADVASKASAALTHIKALDDSLAAAGADGSAEEVESALSLSVVVKDITGSKTLDGINGKLYALSDAAKVAPVALNLSVDQACKLEIDRGIKRGAISPSEKPIYYDRIAKRVLNLSDCQARANGPKLYDVPNTEAAPQGANGTQVELSDPKTASKGNAGALNATPPAELTGAKKVELSAAHASLINALEREMPAGYKVPREKVAEVIAKMNQPATQPSMRNPTA